MDKTLQSIFSSIYYSNAWRNDETVSGHGSTLVFTERMRRQLPKLLKTLGVKSLLDAGCGDWNWMSTLKLKGVAVSACDIVPAMVERNKEKYGDVADFFVSDLVNDPLPKVDLILCRATLFHLSDANVSKALANFGKSCQYMLLTTHPHIDKNVNIADGGWRRLNLCLPPFNLPEPEQIIVDGPGDDGYLGLWKVA